jgi:hypothetical protein
MPRIFRVPFMSLLIASLVMVSVVYGEQPATAVTDEAAIRSRAVSVMDPSQPFEERAVDGLVIESDLEKRFAVEMLKSFKSEYHMFRRAAQAIANRGNGEPLQVVERLGPDQVAAIETGTLAINGDDASIQFVPNGSRGTILYFARSDAGWKFDLLRKYRSRNQIDEDGITVWLNRQAAADEVAKFYETGDQTDFKKIEQLYESEKRKAAFRRSMEPKPTTAKS